MAMELQKDKTPWSPMTFECEDIYGGCLYRENGRCIYNVARVQVRTGRACYQELRAAEIEAELDYLDGCLV